MACEKAMEIIKEFSEYPVKLLTEFEDFCRDGHTKIIVGEMEEILKIIIDPYYGDVDFLTSYDNKKSLQARIKKLKVSDSI